MGHVTCGTQPLYSDKHIMHVMVHTDYMNGCEHHEADAFNLFILIDVCDTLCEIGIRRESNNRASMDDYWGTKKNLFWLPARMHQLE